MKKPAETSRIPYTTYRRHPCRSVFELVFFRLRQFLSALILVESDASTSDASRLNSKDKVIIVLSVEERHKPLLPGKSLDDEQAGDI